MKKSTIATIAAATLSFSALVGICGAISNNVSREASVVNAVAADYTWTAKTYANANSWSNAVAYTSFSDGGFAFAVSGGGNNGKYYTNGAGTWRFYNGGKLTITCNIADKIILSVSTTNASPFVKVSDTVWEASYTATVQVSSITIRYGDASDAGDSVQLTTLSGYTTVGGTIDVTASGSGDITWSTGNSAVATVASTSTGAKITAVGAGTTKITAKVGTATADFTIGVSGHAGTLADPYTASDCNYICSVLSSGGKIGTKSSPVYVEGVAAQHGTNTGALISTTYGNATFDITDGTSSFYMFHSLDLASAKFTEEDVFDVDDYVIYSGILTNYNGTYEMQSDYSALVYACSGAEGKPSSISVDTTNLKSDFGVGDSLTVANSGIVVKGNYAGGVSVDITRYVSTVNGGSSVSLVNGENTINVSLFGLTDSFVVNVSKAWEKPSVLIGAVYGGGGNSGALFTNDYYVLVNTTNAAVDIGGYVLAQGTVNAGTVINKYTLPSGASIPANGYVMVQGGAGTTVTGKPLPVADYSCTLNAAATSGLVALFDSEADYNTSGAGSIDFVRFSGMSNTQACVRKISEGVWQGDETFMADSEAYFTSFFDVYDLTSSAYADALSFMPSAKVAAQLMAADTEGTTCSARHESAKTAVLGLSDRELGIFRNSESPIFADADTGARTRYVAWCTANGDANPWSNDATTAMNVLGMNVSSEGSIALTAILGLGAAASACYFLKKKHEA